MRHTLRFSFSELRFILLFLAAALSFLKTAQSQVPVSHYAVPLTTEKSLSVQLELGTLKLQLGSQPTRHAFEYEFHSPDTASLILDYAVRDNVGYLSLHHKEVSEEPRRRRIRLDWRSLFGGDEPEVDTLRRSRLKLLLPSEIPISFDFSIGAGYNDLDMSGLKVSDLSLTAGACATKLRFSVPNPIPMKKLRISAGASKLTVEGLGNANFEEMEFNGGASDVILDFSGREIRSSKVNISIGAGSVRILLPKHAGVKIKYNDNFFSSLKLPDDFTQDGDWFYSGNFSQVKGVLEMHVSSGVGSVRMRWK